MLRFVGSAGRSARPLVRHVVSCLAGACLATSLAATSPAPSPTPVIAIVGEPNGANVLHNDFRVEVETPLPPGTPPVIEVDYPEGDDYEGRLGQVPELREMRRDVLYRLEGTNLLLIAPTILPFQTEPFDLFEDTGHGTVVASSAIGAANGSAPNGTLAVMVFGSAPESWQWVADNPWISIATTSAGRPVGGCPAPEMAAIAEILEQGGVVFAANGNYDLGATTMATTPIALPGVYQVGAVDADGRPILPGSEPTPTEYPHGNVPTARLYETGDRYRVEMATSGTVDGFEVTHGTSFGSPTTAGRAAEVIAEARRLLGDTTATRVDGTLVRTGPGAIPPVTGPLSDGDLTGRELERLLHYVAQPYFTDVPPTARHLIEGYGALSDATTQAAVEILRGTRPMPQRDEDDQAHEVADTIRAAHFQPQLCGRT